MTMETHEGCNVAIQAAGPTSAPIMNVTSAAAPALNDFGANVDEAEEGDKVNGTKPDDRFKRCLSIGVL
jgi:hypothetical protein